MKRDFTKDPIDRKRIIKHYEKLCTNKYKLGEMGQFFKEQKPTKFTQHEIYNRDSPKPYKKLYS